MSCLNEFSWRGIKITANDALPEGVVAFRTEQQTVITQILTDTVHGVRYDAKFTYEPGVFVVSERDGKLHISATEGCTATLTPIDTAAETEGSSADEDGSRVCTR